MKSIKLNIWIQWVQLWRESGYLFGTMVVPSLFYVFFALPNAKDAASANLLFGSFSCFALLGVVFLFGPRISRDRHSAFTTYIRTLPLSSLDVLLGYGVCILGTAMCAVWIMQIVIGLTSPIDLTYAQILKTNLAVLLGGFPFVLLAVLVGLSTSENASLPVTNALYLILSYLGGLWIPPNALPEKIQSISEQTPTRHLGELAWAMTLNGDLPKGSVVTLACYALLLLVLIFLVLGRPRTAQ